MLFTEHFIILYALRFCSVITLLLCFRWCREFVPNTTLISISMVLAFLNLEIELKHSFLVEFGLSIFKSLSVALPISLAYEALPFIGRFVDVLRGMQFAEISFGQSNQRQSILEIMFDFLIPITFFKSGGHLILLENYLNIQNVISPNLVLELIKISSESLKFAFIFAMPVLSVCIAIEILSMFINRIFPRLSLDLGSAKALIGLFALYCSLDSYPRYFLIWLQTNLYLLVSVN